VAKHDLTQLDAFSAKDEAGKRKHLDDILQWCREHGGQTREQFLLGTLAEAKTWESFAPAAGEAVSRRLQGALPVLVKRFGTFSTAEGNAGVVRLCYRMDSAEAAEPARRWLTDAEEDVRYWAALILLRHGGKEKPDTALDALEPILANDDGTHRYPRAVEVLVETKSQRALTLAGGVLQKPAFLQQPGWIAGPVLQRLFLAGHQECLDYLLVRLGSEKADGGSSGERDGKQVQQSLVEGDDIAMVVASWRLGQAEFDALLPDDQRRAERKRLKTWLAEQFAAIKAGKKAQMKPPSHLIESSGPFLDAP
jgi:hypothetical protein